MKRGEKEGKRAHDITKPSNKRPNQTVVFKNGVSIIGSYSVAGKKEADGPLGDTFSLTVKDEYFGEKTHEAAEQKMFEAAVRGAIKDAKLKPEDINVFLAGDLLNQIISASFAARSFDISFIGLYGACSTMALTLAVGSCLIEGGMVKNAVAAAGSHFATAERQYRTPLELGNQRPPLAQWTVTGVGATILAATQNKKAASTEASDDDLSAVKSKNITGSMGHPWPRITAVTFGKVADWGVNDVNNMGAAMAPAAASTIIAHFKDTNTTPDDFDAIFTGDLGKLGEGILRDLLANANYPVDNRYSDCGRLIYAGDQFQYQGGSGCGCSAVVLNGFIMDKLRRGDYKKILFVATGALLSPVSSFQGNTIPGIAHAVVIEASG